MHSPRQRHTAQQAEPANKPETVQENPTDQATGDIRQELPMKHNPRQKEHQQIGFQPNNKQSEQRESEWRIAVIKTPANPDQSANAMVAGEGWAEVKQTNMTIWATPIIDLQLKSENHLGFNAEMVGQAKQAADEDPQEPSEGEQQPTRKRNKGIDPDQISAKANKKTPVCPKSTEAKHGNTI